MIAPKLPSFFKTSTHRQFNYKSRYFNPKKDDVIQKKKSNAKIEFDKGWGPSKRSTINNKSNRIIFLIIIALFLFSFLLLK